MAEIKRVKKITRKARKKRVKEEQKISLKNQNVHLD